MSDKDRKKKDGHDKGKRNKALQEGHQERNREHAEHMQQEQGHNSDQSDKIQYKRGSESDRTTAGAHGSTS